MTFIGNLFILLGELLNKTRHFEFRISDKCYIYAIRQLNRKSVLYVGKTKQNVESRIFRHLLLISKKKHDNKKLQNKIISTNFLVTYDILEVCNCNVSSKREKHWIDKLNNRNLCNIKNPENPYKDLEIKNANNKNYH